MRVTLPLLAAALMLGGCAAPDAPAPDAPAPASVPDAPAQSPPAPAGNPAPVAGTRWARDDMVSAAGDKITWLVSFAEQVPATQVPDLGRACMLTDALLARALALPVTVTATVTSAMAVSLLPLVQVDGAGADNLLFSPDDRITNCGMNSTQLAPASVAPGSSRTLTFWLVAGDAITPNKPAGDTSRLADVSLGVTLPGVQAINNWSGPLASRCTNGRLPVSLAKETC